MAQLISISTFTGYDGSTASVAVSPSVPLTINVADIQSVRDYTETPTIPGVNALLQVRYVTGNSTRLGELLINESASAIIAAANA